MATLFQVGDEVCCHRNYQASYAICQGATYKIKSVTKTGFCTLEHTPGAWSVDRFVIVAKQATSEQSPARRQRLKTDIRIIKDRMSARQLEQDKDAARLAQLQDLL